MPQSIFKFLVLFVVAVITTTNSHKLEERIVNGIPTLASNYKFIADIRTIQNVTDNEISTSFCTGSILRLQYPATILTAAHCIYPWNGSYPFGVYLSRSDVDANYSNTNNFTFYEVWDYVIHPNYSHIQPPPHDIALLFLNVDLSENKKLSMIRILDIDEACCSHHEALQVIGYGTNHFWTETRTDTLEYANLIYLDHDECNQRIKQGEHVFYQRLANLSNICNSTDIDTDCWDRLFSAFNYPYNSDVPEWYGKYNGSLKVLEDEVCAVGDNQGICSGDSGGPLIKRDTNIQIGITSWKLGCDAPIPDVFTNVTYHKAWIEQQIEYKLNMINYTIMTTQNTENTESTENTGNTRNTGSTGTTEYTETKGSISEINAVCRSKYDIWCIWCIWCAVFIVLS